MQRGATGVPTGLPTGVKILKWRDPADWAPQQVGSPLVRISRPVPPRPTPPCSANERAFRMLHFQERGTVGGTDGTGAASLAQKMGRKLDAVNSAVRHRFLSRHGAENRPGQAVQTSFKSTQMRETV